MHKFYYTYKITLLKGSLAGHYYYGQHRTNNLEDSYCGSGAIIKNYFKKYPKIEHQTYIKEIISFYNSLEELNKAEFELIGDKYKTDPLCLNLKAGGGGYIMKIQNKRKSHICSEETKIKIGIKNRNSRGRYYKLVSTFIQVVSLLGRFACLFGLFLFIFLIRSPLRIFADKEKNSQKSEANHHKLIYRTSLK